MLLLRGITVTGNGCVRVYSSMRGLRSCLAVGKLSIGGTTQQSRPYQWMIGSGTVSSAYQYAEHSSVTQLAQCRSFTTLLHSGCASPVQVNVYTFNPTFSVVRFRRRKMNRKMDQSTQGEEDEVTCEARIVFILSLMLI